jgi:hypothetical protein
MHASLERRCFDVRTGKLVDSFTHVSRKMVSILMPWNPGYSFMRS